MTAPKIAPEQLAALLDGRLDSAARSVLLAQLEKSPEMLEAYADAIAVRRELDEAGMQRPLGQRQRQFGPRAWLAIAAVLLVAVAVPFARRSAPQSDVPASYLIASAVTTTSSPLPADFLARPWDETRSSADQLSPDARAIRLGSRITDFVFLSQRNDSTARSVAFDIAAMLDPIPAGSGASAIFRSFAASPTSPSSSALERVVATAEQLAGPQATRVGAWLEGVRIAATTQDDATLQRIAGVANPSAIGGSFGGSSNAGRELDGVVRLLQASPRDLNAIQAAATRTLSVLANSP